ncbi:MAG TPA: ribosome maturation factor RimP [Alphaproteobacteria bacterium]|nr:ribosome maturation factor RimP [Alphaproteobacteria bacterium]
MSLEQRIDNIITPALLDRGFRVVRVQLQGSKRKNLQIMIERMDGVDITVDDCANVSRIISVLLDVDDPIHESYILEVSSPGLDRPLITKSDFSRFAGSMVKVELKTPYNGSRRFHGHLLGMEGDLVKIELDPQKEVAEFAFSDIQKAKLIPDYEILSSN